MISIELKNYRCFSDQAPLRLELKPGFTAFVGPNNSGKSTILKFLYEFRPLFASLAPNSGQLQLALIGRPASFAFPQPTIRDPHQVFCNTNERPLSLAIRFAHDGPSGSPERAEFTLPHGQPTFRLALFDRENRMFPMPGDGSLEMNHRIVNGKDIGPFFDLLAALCDCVYIPAFRNAVSPGGSQSYYDVAIGHAFIQLWDQWKTGTSTLQHRAVRRLEQEIQEMFGFDDLQINANLTSDSLQVSMGADTYPIAELGSGLAEFVLTLATVAMKRPLYLLIDEPESHLHPALQLRFLTALASYVKPHGGVFFATHSYGLARAAAERIHLVRRERGVTTCVLREKQARLSEALAEMTFSGWQDVGAEAVLLVEGPTDVRTFLQLLSRFGKEHKVAVLPLGGHGMINGDREQELQEVKRLGRRVLAIIDSEKQGAEDRLATNREDFKKSCDASGIECHVMERRATENYFTDRAVRAALGDSISSLGEYEALDGRWSKTENWRIAREMTKDEVSATDLGVLLDLL